MEDERVQPTSSQSLNFMSAYDDLFLPEIPLETFAIRLAPRGIAVDGHDLELDNLVASGLLVRTRPKTLVGRLGKARQSAEARHELVADPIIGFVQQRMAVIVVDRQEYLDEVHCRFPGAKATR